MTGFFKWLNSTKFQIGILAIGLIFLSVKFFRADPNTANSLIRDIALGYFGARVAEPVVEWMIKKVGG
jgi:hypothetical protein